MRYKIYSFLVNKHPGIGYRYHKIHDNSLGKRRILSWAYLLWLNFAYYILFIKSLGQNPEEKIYEEKNLITERSESETHLINNPFLNIDDFCAYLKKYDVISFDVFDTLIFRPVAHPTDVFYLLGECFSILDFKRIRSLAEEEARQNSRLISGHSEVSIYDIWNNMESITGLQVKEGINAEIEIEKNICYPNPFMLEVWNRLKKLGKKIIVVSDMYLPKDCIHEILEKSGFTGAEKIYISNEYGKSKADGNLYIQLISELYEYISNKNIKPGINLLKKSNNRTLNSNGFSIVHVGDNTRSDQVMAQNAGLDVLPYPNVNRSSFMYRAKDMSYMIGSSYRGIVANHLYNGINKYSIEYEYGFIYGGLFAVGFCNFIHEYCKLHNIEKVLFLSRDGDTLIQVYKMMFPEENFEYVYWSRKAAVKLMADEDRHDFFKRFLFHKVNRKITVARVLHSMEADALIPLLSEWKSESFKDERNKPVSIKSDDYLTDKNAYLLKEFLEANWNRVIELYENQHVAASRYYKKILKNCRNAAAVDIGWAGSGAVALSHLVSKVWNIDCCIKGIIAGTNTMHNSEPDIAEPFLQDGRLVSYLFSSGLNRDIYKKHNVNKNYNVYWELLLSSPTPKFVGFYSGNTAETGIAALKPADYCYQDNSILCSGELRYSDELNLTLKFGQYDANRKGMAEIQKGVLDFANQYYMHFKNYPYMLNISGRDAYAPMLAAAGHEEKYLKMIKKRFDFETDVN